LGDVVINTLYLSQFIADRLSVLKEHGITLTISHDMQAMYAIADQLKGKEISPLFNRKFFDVLPDNSFWIYGTDSDGEIIHIQASKMDDTGKCNLEQLLNQQLRRSFNVDTEEEVVGCPATREISGKIAYHGDMWLSPKCRGLKLGDLLGQIGLLVTFNCFKPDYVYGFLEGELSNTGFLFRQGYWNFQPLNKEWVLAHPWLYQEDWLVYMSQDNLEYLLVIDNEKRGRELRPRVKPQNKLEKRIGNS